MSQQFMPDFMKNADANAAAPGVVTAVEAPVEEKKKGRKPKDPNAPKTPKAKEMKAEDIQFIVQNVKTMSYTEMAEARGLTKHQVNRALMDVKKGLREQFAEGTPQRVAADKYIEENLTRPAETRPGAGGGRGGAVKASIDDVVGNILSGLNLVKK